jgi:hypothetical protein
VKWHRWLAAVLVTVALAGCTPPATGLTHAPSIPLSPEYNGDMHGRVGDGGDSM